LGEFGGNPWDALRASRILASKKPFSSLMVRDAGIGPARRTCPEKYRVLTTIFFAIPLFFRANKLEVQNT